MHMHTCTAYIGSAQRSDEEKKERLLSALAVQETDSMERLVECLVEEKTHSGHRHLARRLREALEKKRQHPDGKCVERFPHFFYPGKDGGYPECVYMSMSSRSKILRVHLKNDFFLQHCQILALQLV